MYRKLLSTIAAILFSASALLSAGASAADFQHSTPAASGYDVVSYHTLKRPVRGSGHFASTHKGATYLFASLENKETFEKSPEKYVPAYNGYCAFGVALGKKFAADPEVYRVVDGVLYLNLDATIQDRWLEDVPGMIENGDKNWKKIRKANPASL